MNRLTLLSFTIGIFSLLLSCDSKKSDEEVVNVYSHRHYDTDRLLFKKFTDETGIKVNVVSASADELIQKIELEGANSPADVLITVDAGRLAMAKEKDLLQAIASDYLEEVVPTHFQDLDNYWFGLTYRARVLVYAPDRVDLAGLSDYEDLSDPVWRGKVLTRSSENIYNQSLLASLVVHLGVDDAAEWAAGLVANFARSPKGSDRDQIKAVASGEGDIAIVNSYYLGKLIHSEDAEERQVGKQVAIFFPNQNNRGTHVNVSGAGVARHAPNKENAIKFIEFLASEEAQEIFAKENFEYPVHTGVSWHGQLSEWGQFKADTLNLSLLGKHNREAVFVFDKAGWK